MKSMNSRRLSRTFVSSTALSGLMAVSSVVSSAALENGIAETGLASSTQALNFTLEVPSGASNLNFQMSGGSGDADLYVRYGSAPTSSSYDCRPYQSGNNESCPISNPQAGIYHVMLSPYSAFSNVSLLGSFDGGSDGGGSGGGSGGGTELNEVNLSGAQGSNAYFTLDVPTGATDLSFAMSGGSGDADLYVRFGAQPTSSSYDCRPYQSGNNESCPISNAQAGTYHVMINGYSAYSGVSLSGTYQADSGGGNIAPQAVIANGPYSAEEGNSVSMSSVGSSDSDGSIAGYNWSFGDGQSSTSANPSHTYQSAGTYTVTLTVTDDDGASDSSTTTATITSPSNTSPNAVIANGPFSSEIGEEVSFSSTGSNDPDGSISSYAWNFGDGVSSSSTNPSHSYASAGTYTVELTVTDNNGATGVATDSVTITQPSTGGGGLNETNLSGASNSNTYFTLDVPAGVTNLVFAISGGSGDADLYVRFGAQPTTSTYDCRPYVGGNSETCAISNVQAGTYHVMIRAYSAYSGLSLTGTYDGGSTGGNVAPVAVIANGPFSTTVGQSVSFSSSGSNDADGSIASY